MPEPGIEIVSHKGCNFMLPTSYTTHRVARLHSGIHLTLLYDFSSNITLPHVRATSRVIIYLAAAVDSSATDFLYQAGVL